MSATRVRRLAALTVALVLALGSGPGLATADEKASPRVTFVFVGDIMLDREPGRVVLAGVDPFAHVAGVIDGADFTVGNLQCVIATSGSRADKFFTFRADPRAITPLSRHFDAVSLANNHTGDFGHEALVETMDRLNKGNVRYFGAGRDRKEAHAPWVAEKNGVRVAVLGYNEFWPRSFEAGPATPGCAWSIDEQVVADIKAAHAAADVVVTYTHWAEEDRTPPNPRQKALARTMIDAGADVVVGNHHPHAVGETESYKGKLIVYSLGNFVFDEYKGDVIGTPPVLKEERRVGWALRLTLDKTGLVEWDSVVTRTDDDGLPRLNPAGKAGPSGGSNR